MPNFTRYTVNLVKEKTTRYDITRVINNSSEMYHVATDVIGMDSFAEEYLYMLAFNMKLNLIGYFEVSHAVLDHTIAHPREIYKRALLCNASSVALLHNHTSGNPTPSQSDYDATTRVASAGRIIGVDLLDHIVVGDGIYVSIRETNPELFNAEQE